MDTRMNDLRKEGLKNGLRQLTLEQLNNVLNYDQEMCLDNFNFFDGKFCPLAIAVGLDKSIINPTHDKVFSSLTNMGYHVFNTRGIIGNFYQENRKEDLILAVKEVIQEKKNDT